MKKILLSIGLLLSLNVCLKAQMTLVYEDFEGGAPENYDMNPPGGADNFWINFDGDGLPDGSSQGRPGEWFSGQYDIYDSLNTVAASNSWTNEVSTQIQNWLITPPLNIIDPSFTLSWKSFPYQTPL